MTNSTKQAIRTVSNNTMSALGHKTLVITESESSNTTEQTEFVPKLLEQIMESKPKKQDKFAGTSSSMTTSSAPQQHKRNTPLAKMSSLSIEEDILEENENTNEEESMPSVKQQSSTQNQAASPLQAKTEPLPPPPLAESSQKQQASDTAAENKPLAPLKTKKAAKPKEKPKNIEITEEKVDEKPKSKRKAPKTPTSAPPDDIAEHFDLYKTQNPSLLYIKQKYKMYLDWLAENSSIENLLSASSTSSGPSTNGNNGRKNGEPQLNWYHYEKSLISSNNKNYFKYLENISHNFNHHHNGGLGNAKN